MQSYRKPLRLLKLYDLIARVVEAVGDGVDHAVKQRAKDALENYDLCGLYTHLRRGAIHETFEKFVGWPISKYSEPHDRHIAEVVNDLSRNNPLADHVERAIVLLSFLAGRSCVYPPASVKEAGDELAALAAYISVPQLEDGPCEPNAWRQGQEVFTGMSRCAHNLVSCLWQSERKTVNTDDLTDLIDINGSVQDFVRNHRSSANKFFSDHGISWSVERSPEKAWMKKVEQ